MSTGPSSTPASASASATPGAVRLADVTTLKVDLPRGTDFPTAVDGALWILSPDVGDPAAVRVDPDSGAELARVPVGGRLCQGLVAGFGSIWACSDSGMTRIDPATNTVEATIAYPAPRVFGRPAVGDDAIWALSGTVIATSVVRIDPATNTVTATYPLGHAATNVAWGAGALWATSPEDGLLLRVDPATGTIAEALNALPSPTWIAFGAGRAWVILYGIRGEESLPPGTPVLLRYDPSTAAADRFDIGGSPAEAGDLLATDSAVWVKGGIPTIVRVDPASGIVTWGVDAPGLGDGAIGLGFDALWLTSVDRGTLWRLALPD
jgi:streptogramin lyase